MRWKLSSICNYSRASLALASVAMMMTPGMARAQSERLSQDLKAIAQNQSVDVIVQYRVTPTATHYARVLNRGGSLHTDLRGMHAGSFHVPANQLEAIANDPDVKYVSQDRPIKAKAYSYNPDFYEDAIQAQAAWNRYDGSGIGIAVIDSGISYRRDFGNRIVYNESFVDNEGWITNDPYGHGTHVAGILAGNGANSTGWFDYRTFIGVASNANLINLRALDETGSGSDSQVIAAIQRAIELKNQYNIRIINLSLGRGVFESYAQDPLCQAVEAAWKAGIVVVVAAGNDGRDDAAGTNGYGTINAPGNDPYAITVGAMKPMGTPTRTDDLIATYSSKGPTLFDDVVKPDLVAPGNQVISVLASTHAALFNWNDFIPMEDYSWWGDDRPSTAYFMLNGTSMAAAVVSGGAALVLQQNPNMTPDQVKARLMKTAYKTFPRYSTATDPTTGQSYTDQYDIFTVGAGYLDLQNATQNTELAPAAAGSALSPTAVLSSDGNISITTGSSVIWGGSVLWGTDAVWGSSVWQNPGMQADTVLWGTSFIQGSSVLWGSSAPSAATVLWGTTTNDAETLQIVAEQ